MPPALPSRGEGEALRWPIRRGGADSLRRPLLALVAPPPGRSTWLSASSSVSFRRVDDAANGPDCPPVFEERHGRGQALYDVGDAVHRVRRRRARPASPRADGSATMSRRGSRPDTSEP